MDVILMTRLLNNLISNAFRYGSDGGHVRVTVRRTGNCVVLSVSDDGAGIPPDQQEKIWQRFYQVDAARSGGEGTGLGCTWYARSHGCTAVRRRWRVCPGRAAHSPCGSRRNDTFSPPAGGENFFISPIDSAMVGGYRIGASSRKDDRGAPTLKIGDFSKLSPGRAPGASRTPRLTVGAL